MILLGIEAGLRSHSVPINGFGLTIILYALSQFALASELPSKIRTAFIVIRAPSDGRFITLNSDRSLGLSCSRTCSCNLILFVTLMVESYEDLRMEDIVPLLLLLFNLPLVFTV